MGFVEELSWRGLLHQHTGAEKLIEHLQTPGRVAYCGFDPTRDSLTVGNLVPIMLLKHWQLAGHRPIVLVGGGTGLIGDPSGKDKERQLLNRDQVEANVAGQRRILEQFLDFEGPQAAQIVNNADWLTRLGFLEVLRDLGKHFSVNAMIQKDSVRERLQTRDQGISYTEFSYMLLQAYDFWHLYREHGCTVQLAGSDQYGNIVAGIDVVHRREGREADGRTRVFGLTAPLLMTSEGKKIGKSEKGAIYLSADRTSPYQFYQYWLNVDDHDAVSFLKWFTLLGQRRAAELAQEHAARPQERGAQRELARQVTRMVHGQDELVSVEAASEALFRGDVRQLSDRILDDVLADVPHSEHEAKLLAGEGLPLIELLPCTTLAKSKREAREFASNGAVAVNSERAGPDRILRSADLLHGRTILLRRGKKKWHATRWA